MKQLNINDLIMIQIIPFTNLPLTWSTDNMMLKIKPQSLPLYSGHYHHKLPLTTFSPEDKIHIVLQHLPITLGITHWISCLLSVLSLKHFMCVGEPVLRKIDKHYIIRDSIGWSENSLLSHLLLKEVCSLKGKKRK